MDIFTRTKRLHRHYPKLGPILYISAVQYFLVQLLVGLRFSPRYSLSFNTISDLGNSKCAIFNNRQICSPLHPLMNTSFLILGFTMITGSLLLYNLLEESRKVKVGFSLFAVGGLGAILVGLFPENTVSALHGIGASLPFLVGNIGLVLIAFSNKLPKLIRIYTLLTGSVALIALGVYASGHYLGLGQVV